MPKLPQAFLYLQLQRTGTKLLKIKDRSMDTSHASVHCTLSSYKDTQNSKAKQELKWSQVQGFSKSLSMFFSSALWHAWRVQPM